MEWPQQLAIPGKLAVDEMQFLAALARLVPPGGRIVEIGPLYGRSTDVMARANPAAQITSVDTFEDLDWTKRYAGNYREIPAFSRAAFENFTKDNNNITAITGYSPQALQDWCEPIDMYFEDALHGNPGLRDNLDFWSAHIKPGGILCGHDFTQVWPDVRAEAQRIAVNWGAELRIVHSLWAIRKPPASLPLQPPLASAINSAPLRVQAKPRGAALATEVPGGYWCGLPIDGPPLLSVSITRPGAQDAGVQLEYRLDHPDHGSTDWAPEGEVLRLMAHGKARPFTRFAVRIKGPNPEGWRVVYAVRARSSAKHIKLDLQRAATAMDGKWATHPGEARGITAISARLIKTPYPGSQSAFTPTQPLRHNLREAVLKAKHKAILRR